MQWPQSYLKKNPLKSSGVFFASVKLVCYGNKVLLIDFFFNVSSLDWSIDPWWHDCQYWGEVRGHVNKVQDPETHQNHERDCLESCPGHSQGNLSHGNNKILPSCGDGAECFGWGSTALREEDAEAALSFCSCGWTFMARLENVVPADCWGKLLGRTWEELRGSW